MNKTYSPPSLTKKQAEILTGLLLGDAHLETTTNKTFRLKLEQSIKKILYSRTV